MIHFVEQLVKAYHKLDVFSDESKLVQVLQSHPPTRLELATRLNRLMVDDERMEKAAPTACPASRQTLGFLRTSPSQRSTSAAR